ncbi:MAG: ACT domain-containing protein [Myxococcota bacterium]
MSASNPEPRIPLVLTVLGRDRPGIVQQLAAIVADAGGNWEESNLVRLAGRFAGVVSLTAPDEATADALERGLRAVGGGLQVVVDRGDAEARPPTPRWSCRSPAPTGPASSAT